MNPSPEAKWEPPPIDLPPATVERARALLRDLQAAQAERSEFDPQINAMMTDEKLQSVARVDPTVR